MMCEHCERAVKTALESLNAVSEATASHEKGEVRVKLNGEVDDKALREAVVNAGYKVKSIKRNN